jgi:hypothetical protein
MCRPFAVKNELIHGEKRKKERESMRQIVKEDPLNESKTADTK